VVYFSEKVLLRFGTLLKLQYSLNYYLSFSPSVDQKLEIFVVEVLLIYFCIKRSFEVSTSFDLIVFCLLQIANADRSLLLIPPRNLPRRMLSSM
jgi:hypothetical protein